MLLVLLSGPLLRTEHSFSSFPFLSLLSCVLSMFNYFQLDFRLYLSNNFIKNQTKNKTKKPLLPYTYSFSYYNTCIGLLIFCFSSPQITFVFNFNFYYYFCVYPRTGLHTGDDIFIL
jgi:hypothetical protein